MIRASHLLLRRVLRVLKIRRSGGIPRSPSPSLSDDIAFFPQALDIHRSSLDGFRGTAASWREVPRRAYHDGSRCARIIPSARTGDSGTGTSRKHTQGTTGTDGTLPCSARRFP